MKEITSKPISEGSDDIFFKTNTADGLEKIRSRLLDLTHRNKLLNFHHTKKTTLRVVDSIPDTLFNRLTENKSLTFKPIPEPKKEEYQEINVANIGKKPSATQYAEKIGIPTDFDLNANIADNTTLIHPHIQTLHYPLELEAILRKIESGARTAIEESGTNFLYLSFGFLEWLETDTSSQSYLAPLFLMPVSVARNKKPNHQTGAFEYSIEYSGEDLAINYCLSEKLKRDFGLDLPDYGEGDTPEKYFRKFSGILASKSHWKIRRFITLGFFYFGKLLMFRDLDPNKSNILSHPIINDLFEGTKIEGFESGEIYSLDDPKIEEKVPQIIFDADSSQHSALIDALSGKNLVIEGPPGTGKSQTITNLITASLVQGKTVLFVSEKLAALEVVRRRLDEAGLGKFCLELHSHKTKKRELLEDLDGRLTFKGHFKDPSQLDHKLMYLKNKKKELLQYVDFINSKFGNLGKTVFDILWGEIRYRGELKVSAELLEHIILENANAISQSDLDEIELILESYSNHFRIVLNDKSLITHNLWYGIANANLTFLQEKDILRLLRELKRLCGELISQVSDFSTKIQVAIELTPRSLISLIISKDLLPQVSCNEFNGLLPKLAIQDNKEIVSKFLNEYSFYRDELEKIKSYFHEIPTIERGIIEGMTEFLAESEHYNLSSFVLQQLIDLLGEWQKIIKDIKRLGIFYKHLNDNFLCTIPFTVTNIRFMLSATKIILNSPLDAILLHQVNYEDDHLYKYFDIARKEYINLIENKNRLEGLFTIDKNIGSGELKKHSKVLLRPFLRRFWNINYWKARRLFKRLYRGEEGKIDVKTMAKDLDDLASYTDQLIAFDNNKQYQLILGKNFDGLNTDFDTLSILIEWYGLIRSDLPLHLNYSNILAKAIMNFPRAKVMELIEFINKNDDNITNLELLFNELMAFFSKSPISINFKVEHDLIELVLFIEDMSATANNIINTLSGLHFKDDVSLIHGINHITKLDNLNNNLEKLRKDKKVKEIFEHKFPDLDEIEKIDLTLKFADSLHNCNLPMGIKRWLFSPDVSNRLNELKQFIEIISSLMDRYSNVFIEFVNLADLNWKNWIQANIEPPDIDFCILEKKIDSALCESESLSDWLNFLRSHMQLDQYGLTALSDLVENNTVNINELSIVYYFILYNSLVRFIHDKYSSLIMKFNGLTLDGIRNRFREFDVETIELYRERAACLIDQRTIISGISTGPVGHWTNLALIRHEIRKKKRNIPIRQLMNRAGEALQGLKPCFMMGPLSVAQYLAPGGLKFDLLVMDEASQLKPEDALGAICRSSQIVIVGDPKQLPPTAFFDRLFEEDYNDGDDNNLAIQGVESILDIASSLYQPIRKLNWHYRSRHGSLIAFSNKEFYKNNLIVFPSPIAESPSLGVKYHYIPKAIYENRRNNIEAKYIVDSIMIHMEENPRESLGVVALNSTQRELIERIFEERIKNDPFAQNYIDARQKGAEPFFIKNLENVQGDERDVIFISITYGRDARGNLFQRFGPINGINGGRRLNVLFTRAKKRTEVFTSMDPDEIRLGQDAQEGVHALKGYLSFAKTGFIDTPIVGSAHQANDFEISVGNALNNCGFQVEYQVGVAGFFIDLAVWHPQKHGTYILGIECDGATYHSARSVRERDRLRQDILENLGWKIHRIWSTDWFSNKKKEIDNILTTIDRILQSEKPRDRKIVDRIAQISPCKAPSLFEETTPSLFEEHIEETEPIKPIKKALSEKLFLTVEEARKQLIDLRENVIKKEFPNAAPENGLLRKSMMDMLLKELPTDKKEFLTCLPLSLRDKTDPKQMKYIEVVLNILAEVVE